MCEWVDGWICCFMGHRKYFMMPCKVLNLMLKLIKIEEIYNCL
jgi:hypothetical protein